MRAANPARRDVNAKGTAGEPVRCAICSIEVLFAILLILHLLMETMAAVALIGGPEGIAAAGQGVQWSMHYGFAALAMASVSLWVWPRRDDLAAVTVALGLLVTFHVGLTISLAVAGDQVGGMIGHAVLALISLVLITQRTRVCAPA